MVNYRCIRYFLVLIGLVTLLTSCTGENETDALLDVDLSDGGSSELGNSALEFTPTIWDFGPNELASVSDKTITITNTSSFVIYLDSVSADNSHFSLVSHNCPLSPQSMKPQTSCTASMRFSPSQTGDHSVSLIINYDKTPGGNQFYSAMGIDGSAIGELNFDGIKNINPSDVTAGSVTVRWDSNVEAVNYFNVYLTVFLKRLSQFQRNHFF